MIHISSTYKVLSTYKPCRARPQHPRYTKIQRPGLPDLTCMQAGHYWDVGDPPEVSRVIAATERSRFLSISMKSCPTLLEQSAMREFFNNASWLGIHGIR